jgi:S-adenosylmethionine:tRNA ribosyltransferase-isomerase
MIAADHPHRSARRLLVVDAGGGIRHLGASGLATLFEPGDLVVANDAATLPASLFGVHAPTGTPVEVRLAGWGDGSSPAERGPPVLTSPFDPTYFTAIVFGAGDHRLRTEDRPLPPRLSPGDRLLLGPLVAAVDRVLNYPRLVALSFNGDIRAIWTGLARHGRPIQYAHVPEPLALPDVWTRIAAMPVAFEPPSAGFALDWRTLAAWRKRGIGFATLTHAAGISSTGDPVLDARLPFDEPYRIPEKTASAIARTRSRGGRIIAIGTTVVRALEAAAAFDGKIHPGEGIATGRIGEATELYIADAILSGVHQLGESHFELLRAFVDEARLDRMSGAAKSENYRSHEFGDFVLVERQPRTARTVILGPREARNRGTSGLLTHDTNDRPVTPMSGRVVAAKLRRIDSGRAASVQK